MPRGTLGASSMTEPGLRIPRAALLRRVEIFRSLGEEERDALSERMEVRRYRGGDAVFREGDPSDGLYVVHTGEVCVVTEVGGERRLLARLGPGECFGEMSLLTGEPRSTSILASLDSDLLFLRDAAFDGLVRRHPGIALAIGRTLSQRLRRANLAARGEERERILLCDSASEGMGCCAFAESLAGALAACRGCEVLLICLGRPPDRGAALAGPGDLRSAIVAGAKPALAEHAPVIGDRVREIALAAAPGGWEPRHLGSLLGEALAQFGGAVLSGDPDERESPGAARLHDEALRQCDAAFLLVDPSDASLERASSILSRSARGDAWRIVLVRPPVLPAGTVERIETKLGVPVAHHLVPGDRTSLERLARRISRVAVGLALGGGGARGLAHIGILEVFGEERIPIDVVGGTSIGSILAALHALGHPPSRAAEIVRREWVERNPLTDFTLPKAGLVRGRKGEKVLRRVMGDVRIEDLVAPFFAVAADLVAAEEVVLARGPLWLAVRASGSIPILLTPVKVDRRFLVDGGIINNVPGDHLGRFGADVSVAVDVSPRREPYFDRLIEEAGGRGPIGRLVRRSALIREWLDYPNILRTLRRIIAIEGLEIMKTKSAAFDVCIQPAVDGFDLLDFGKIDRLIEAGREAARQALPSIRARMEDAARRGAPEGTA